MTARFIYVPRLIESAEQAEALPVGTVAHDRDHGTEPDLIPYVKVTPRFWVSVWDVSGDHELDAYGVCPNSHMVGDSALVPIEAEEEWALIYDGEEPTPCADEADAREWAHIDGEGQAPSRRYNTPWEETP